MNNEKILLTKEGLEKLKIEHRELVEVVRPKVIAELKRTRELGDLSENGAYHAAREKQAFIEGRIKELEAILKNVIVSMTKDRNIVSLGSNVLLQINSKNDNMPTNRVSYTIVGSGESDLLSKKVAYDSPLGKAIFGKKKGERIVVEAPSGKTEYTIVNIE